MKAKRDKCRNETVCSHMEGLMDYVQLSFFPIAEERESNEKR